MCIRDRLHIDSSEEVLAARTNKAPADEVRAVWIAYLDLAPVLKGKTEAQFKESIGKMYDNCVSIGLNTVIVQVRPFSDSFYPVSYTHLDVYKRQALIVPFLL